MTSIALAKPETADLFVQTLQRKPAQTFDRPLMTPHSARDNLLPATALHRGAILTAVAGYAWLSPARG